MTIIADDVEVVLMPPPSEVLDVALSMRHIIIFLLDLAALMYIISTALIEWPA